MTEFDLSPINTKYIVKLDNHIFNSPLHYIYYYSYAITDEERLKILNTTLPSILQGYGYQLRVLQISNDEINKKLYTLIAYLYCVYRPFRQMINAIKRGYRPRIQLVNDSFYGATKYKYSKALISFANALQ